MSDFIIGIVVLILGIFGISYGASQRTKRKELEDDNAMLSAKLSSQVNKEQNTIKEVQDVKAKVEQIHKEATSRRNASSKLDQLRNNKKAD